MNVLRAHRLPLAWMLFAFILFNGFACSIGHGLMMAMAAAPDEHAQRQGAGGHAGMDMSKDMGMAMSMPMITDASAKAAASNSNHDSLKAMFGDCTFAGILALALLGFAALGWRVRLRQPFAAAVARCPVCCFRLFFPALNPRAP